MSWFLPSTSWSHSSSCDIYCCGLYVSDPSLSILEHQEPLEINPGLPKTQEIRVTPPPAAGLSEGEGGGHRAAPGLLQIGITAPECSIPGPGVAKRSSQAAWAGISVLPLPGQLPHL